MKKKEYKGTERRKHKRYDFPYPVKFSPEGKNKFETSLCGNISYGGLMLISPNLYPDDQQLDIVISYSIENQAFLLQLLAKVVWGRNIHSGQIPNNKFIMGVEFIKVSGEQKVQLEKFINGYCNKIEGDSGEPRDARGYFIRGVQRFNDDLKGAISDFSRTIELSPNHAAAYYYRAFARDRDGDAKAADEDFKKSQELGGI